MELSMSREAIHASNRSYDEATAPRWMPIELAAASVIHDTSTRRHPAYTCYGAWPGAAADEDGYGGAWKALLRAVEVVSNISACQFPGARRQCPR